MTYKEKFLHDHPETMVLEIIGKCPAGYGYEPDTGKCPDGIRSTCSKCWNREMPQDYLNLEGGESSDQSKDDCAVSDFKVAGSQ